MCMLSAGNQGKLAAKAQSKVPVLSASAAMTIAPVFGYIHCSDDVHVSNWLT